MATRNSNRNESNRNRSDSKPYKVVYGIVQREGMEKSFLDPYRRGLGKPRCYAESRIMQSPPHPPV